MNNQANTEAIAVARANAAIAAFGLAKASGSPNAISAAKAEMFSMRGELLRIKDERTALDAMRGAMNKAVSVPRPFDDAPGGTAVPLGKIAQLEREFRKFDVIADDLDRVSKRLAAEEARIGLPSPSGEIASRGLPSPGAGHRVEQLFKAAPAVATSPTPFARGAVQAALGRFTDEIASALIATRNAVLGQLRTRPTAKRAPDDDDNTSDLDELSLAALLLLLDQPASPARAAAVAQAVTAKLDLGGLAAISETDELSHVAADAALRAGEAVGLTDFQQSDAEADAQSLATGRMAELVSDDPNAQQSIVPTTRAAIAEAIEDGLIDGDGAEAIVEAVSELAAWSAERAQTIAVTELSRANNDGAMTAYHVAVAAGGDWKKVWVISPDEKTCPVCVENAAAGPIPMEARFPSRDLAPVAHPNCRCAISVVTSPARYQGRVRKGYDPDEPRDAQGRWTSDALPTLTIAATKEEQRAKLIESWAKHGRAVDFDDISDAVWYREAWSWDREHGTSIYDDAKAGKEWRNDEFDAHLDGKYLAGRKAPFPGVDAANEYFENQGEHEHGVYLRGKQPEDWGDDGKPRAVKGRFRADAA